MYLCVCKNDKLEMLELIKNFFKKTIIEQDPMKYLIVGLGNIGADYENTRHNVGFLVVEQLAKAFEMPFKSENLGSIARVKHKSRTFILLKPSTYMNLSGKAVRYWMQKENIDKENILVILDDLALPFGKQRLRPNGSAGGHNGLKSIEALLGDSDYARLRIGIGSDFAKGQQADYVLGDWGEAEAEKLPEITKYAGEVIKAFGVIGLQLTMTQYNKK
jgi:PTH1 family peptidyl-tRNA hydrolase